MDNKATGKVEDSDVGVGKMEAWTTRVGEHILPSATDLHSRIGARHCDEGHGQ